MLRQLVKLLNVHVAQQGCLFKTGDVNAAEILGPVYCVYTWGSVLAAIMASDILIRTPAAEKYLQSTQFIWTQFVSIMHF